MQHVERRRKQTKTSVVLVLGHRGASADAPENTLPAFAEAERQGADGIELDAMLCGSGEVVVCHDERLDRLAGLPWVVRETPLWKLQQADVGSHLGYESARIPTLVEVLGAVPAHFLVNIELKCSNFDDRGLSRRVVELVQAAGARDRVLISSFNAVCLWRVAQVDPTLRRGFLVDPDRSYFLLANVLAPLVSSHSVHFFYKWCTPDRVAGWRNRGIEVAAWTVDDPQTTLALQQMGVRYCITNRPGLIRERGRAA
jgi:glycerophosphoryl diester phosphodiesterase